MKDFSIPLLFDYYGASLSEKQQQIFDSYYNLDLSLSEIAENMGITRQGVRDFIKRTEQQLLSLEESLHFAEKCTKLKQAAQGIAPDSPELLQLKEMINDL